MGKYIKSAISIHAPARGATIFPFFILLSDNRFQSTLPRGERHQRVLEDLTPKNFNPRSREGSDFINIMIPLDCYHFNPRSREGSDECRGLQGCLGLRFQSTLPRGERRDILNPISRIFTFQSTLPRGERPWLPVRRW